MAINETVLEMHYHGPLMELFRRSFGLGNPGGFNFYKYSPQKECFIGFDQAYVRTDLDADSFFNMLRQTAMNTTYKLNDVYVGFFFQFKVVKQMQANTRYTPANIVNRPYYRVSLDTKKNMSTGVSQHELLFNLSQNQGSMVYYACPMIFDRSELYDININFDKLRLADLQTCPSRYADNDNHFIFYNDINSNPIWCSEPRDGIAISPIEFTNSLLGRIESLEPISSRKALYDMLTNVRAVGLSEEARFFEGRQRRDILELTHDSLIIMRISRG